VADQEKSHPADGQRMRPPARSDFVTGEEAQSLKSQGVYEVADAQLQVRALAEGLEFIEDLRPELISADVLRIIPEDIATREKIVAIRFDSPGELIVATSDPDNIFITDVLPAKLNITRIKMAVAKEQDILACIESNYQLSDSEMMDIKRANEFAPQLRPRANEIVIGDDDATTVPSGITIFHSLLRRALKRHASDLSIEPGESEARIRLKIDGHLVALEPPPHPGWYENLVAAIKGSAGMNTAERRRPLDGYLTAVFGDQRYDVRVATMPTFWGEGTTLRILNPKDAEMSLEQIGFDLADIKLLDKQIHLPNGVILITGPTGSGKTTTLYACLNRRNDDETKIITVEDPVEYHVSGFNQSSVNEEVGFDFAAGLKASLRQIPDVILIGEMRDAKTAEVTMRAALTGHLVLSTLHTNDAVSSVVRLTDMGVEPFMIAESVRAVVAQRLVRRLCAKCAGKPKDIGLAGILGIPDDVDTSKLRGAVGCKSCNGSGYQGRTVIYEILVLGEKVKDAITQNRDSATLRQLARENQMRTLQESGCAKVLAGVTTLEEVYQLTATN
jgi:type IV pilus assembly protein PilB